MNTPNLFSQGPQPMTLSQFTSAIGNAVRSNPALMGAWVMAELSDVRYNGGHCYMELIEKNPAGQTLAKLRAAIWANQVPRIRQKFFQATGRDVQSGLKVMLFGNITHHNVYGLSFVVGDIDPSYTLGDIERLRREILERLHREGVLGMNKTQHMPAAPQRIAVISAEGAAGYGDFMNQLTGNSEGFVFYPHLFGAVMQGDRTSASIRAALDFIEQTIDLWDCVVIIRGGGATTDLNGFDDYDLARAVATFPLPIVVGIGHERDRTVLDEIAHTRCKTPTAVAAFFIDTVRASFDRVGNMVDWISRYSTDRIQGEQRRLANAEAMIPALAKARIDGAKALLDRELTRIPVLVESRIKEAGGKLDTIARVIGVRADAQCQRAAQTLDSLMQRITTASDNALKRAAAKVESLEGMVEVLSPQNTLKRGYSITRVDGKAVTKASALAPGQEIETQLKDGTVISTVK